MSGADELPADLRFLVWLIVEGGMLHPRPIPGGRWAAVLPKFFTHAIVTGPMGDYETISRNWCYETRAEAEAALEAWDGHGDPEGWIRNPETGRRRARTGEEYDADGRLVPIGEVYFRP